MYDLSQDGEYDLDLTYITGNVIAMSMPGESITAFYRNSFEDVKQFLHKVYTSLSLSHARSRSLPTLLDSLRILGYPLRICRESDFAESFSITATATKCSTSARSIRTQVSSSQMVCYLFF